MAAAVDTAAAVVEAVDMVVEEVVVVDMAAVAVAVADIVTLRAMPFPTSRSIGCDAHTPRQRRA